MQRNAKRFNAPPLEYLNRDQMQDIHSASVHILEDVGSVIHNEEAIHILDAAGAHIQDENRVFIPVALVEQALRTAPSRITVYDRNGTAALFLQDRNVYYGTGSDCMTLIDSFSGQRRDFLYRDVEDAVRLVDFLPHIDFVMCMGLAPDIPAEEQYQQKYAAMIRNSIKPQVVVAGDRKSLATIVDMAAAIRGSHTELRRQPLFVLYDEPTSPLVHTHEAIDKLLFAAEYYVPINYSPGIMAGGTAPITMAGAVTQANAEILTGLVIHQLKQAGAPFVFGGGMSPMDMKSMQPTFSSPEAMMEQAGLCQIGRCLYHLPTWGFGGCSASKLPDEQAVNEAATYILMAGLMGTNLVHDVGYLEFGLTYSFDLLVMCDEFIGQIRRMMTGIRVDREYLALDAIKRVGPGGHFLQDDHTLEHFRENWQPDLTDRNTFETWSEAGSSSMGQRAKQKIKKILDTHQPEPLAPEIQRQIDTLVKDAK